MDTKLLEKSKKHYAHFDYRTDLSKVINRVKNPEWVSHHGFYPFIHYQVIFHKYKRQEVQECAKGKKEQKTRDICYAAHIDRCILQYYCYNMNEIYNYRIKEYNIDDVPIAYRSDLGKNNIHFAKEAIDFINKYSDCFIMIGDYTKFFDNLDHSYLKERLCQVLEVEKLPADYYNIFKNITKYSIWELDDLLELNNLSKTISGKNKLNKKDLVITRDQFKRYRSHIKKNQENYGIPQGSPISAILANVYMFDTDQKIKSIVTSYKGIYRRYSDDFIIVLPAEEDKVRLAIQLIKEAISQTPNLILEPKKTQIYRKKQTTIYNVGELFLDEADQSQRTINFLGFTYDGYKVKIRSKTEGKYYYRLYRKARRIAKDPEHKGKKYLYQKYSERGSIVKGKGNFLTYVKRAQEIFPEYTSHIWQPFKNNMSKIKKGMTF